MAKQAPPRRPAEAIDQQEPPAGTERELLWRLAQRLRHEHQAEDRYVVVDGSCRACAQPWPCSGWRLGELGLNAARL